MERTAVDRRVTAIRIRRSKVVVEFQLWAVGGSATLPRF